MPLTSGSSSQGTRLFLNALFEADCVTGRSPSVPGDSDGDGVPDSADAAPTDPNARGDSDGNGRDDCASGHFDLTYDCSVGDGSSGGCCDARAQGSVGRLLPRRARPRLAGAAAASADPFNAGPTFEGPQRAPDCICVESVERP